MTGPRVFLPVAILAASLILLLQPGEAQPWGGFGPHFGSNQNFPQIPTGPPNITCDQLNCAKGTCNINSSTTRNGPNYSYNFSYSCKCDQGWSWAPFSFSAFQLFVPCVLPNCTATGCSVTEPAPKPFEPNMNVNLTDPCLWAYCGDGECVAKSAFTYECNCKPGFKNLFNDTVYPCYSDCSIGAQCQKQGVGFLPITASPGGSPGSIGGRSTDGGGPGGAGGSAANSAMPDHFLGLLIAALSLAVVIA